MGPTGARPGPLRLVHRSSGRPSGHRPVPCSRPCRVVPGRVVPAAPAGAMRESRLSRPISGGGAAGPGAGGQSRPRRCGTAPGTEAINVPGPAAAASRRTGDSAAAFPAARPTPGFARPGPGPCPPGAGQRGSLTKGQRRSCLLPAPRRHPPPPPGTAADSVGLSDSADFS